MKTFSRFVRAVLFVFVFLLLLSVSGCVFQRPHGEDWATETGMDLVRRFRGQYDVIFAGTSVVIANISCKALYDHYGIKSVSVGEPEQPLFLTKYTVEEVLRYQHPKVVLMDAKSFFYADTRVEKAFNKGENYYIHNTLDSIHSPLIKRKALQQVRKYKEVDEKAYYFRMYHRHSQWKDLQEINFRDCNKADTMNGNIMLTGLYEEETDFKEREAPFREEVQQDVLEIREMCRKEGADLVLMISSRMARESNRDQVREFARENQMDLLEINDVMDEIGFTRQMMRDRVHFNIVGTTVWTDYIGRYLSEKYSFDPSSERMDRFYQRQSENYAAYMNCTRNKMLFHETRTFKEFLKTIIDSDLKDTAILVAVNDDAYGALDEEGKELLKQIGLDGPPCFKGSYVAVCVTDGIHQEGAEQEKVTVSGTDVGLYYTVESAGANVEGEPSSSINVNGVELATGQRGFQFVLYDRKIGDVIAKKCFDTCMVADPNGSELELT